jgi:hypothetical protein
MQHSVSGSGLADVLERILDKGIVVAGDVAVNLVGVDLLTIRIRLVICSVDRALELGIRWWETDPALSADAARLQAENRALSERLCRLEQGLALSEGVAVA